MADNMVNTPYKIPEEPNAGGMEITPHEPVMRYEVKGYPLNSMDAFILFVNGTEIYSLTTNNKTIVGAINELKALIDGFDLSKYATKEEVDEKLKDYAKLTDLVNFVTSDEFNKFKESIKADVNNHTVRIATLEGDISSIKAQLAEIIPKLPNDAIFHVLTTFTNPRYFKERTHWGTFTTDNYVAFSYDTTVEQSIQLEDGILEVININLLRNVEVDFTKTPTHFFIPAVIDFYDDAGVYTKSQHVMLDAEWTIETNSYDISVYFKGIIENINEHTTIRFSGMIPYKVS